MRAKQFLDFTPTLAYVQSNSTFELSAVFKPTTDILNILKKYIDVRNSTEVEKKIKIPVKVIVTNQSIPILFDIIAILTTDEVEILPNIIDFGKQHNHHRPNINLKISNKSILVQHIEFCKFPNELKIDTNEVKLNSYETIYKNIIWDPSPLP